MRERVSADERRMAQMKDVNPQAVSRGCWDCEARRVWDARAKRRKDGGRR